VENRSVENRSVENRQNPALQTLDIPGEILQIPGIASPLAGKAC
jgi:hypothetical protein